MLGKDFDYKCHVVEDVNGKENAISPWHVFSLYGFVIQDISYISTPYLSGKPAIVNFVMEIPRGQFINCFNQVQSKC